ncbi:MAG TPA: DoxX family protein [Candidatus Paceibacterota bacterium]|nr:DoxX family protein [Candidatus Paceibacterota bacterium]
MDSWSDIFAPLVGRIFMGGFFLWNGIEAALNFPATTVLFVTAGMPGPIGLALVAVAVEVVCGILLVVGSFTKYSAILLSCFVFLTALLHPGTSNAISQTLFLQDMAIIGGLFYISAYGSGAWSTDWKYVMTKKAAPKRHKKR